MFLLGWLVSGDMIWAALWVGIGHDDLREKTGGKKPEKKSDKLSETFYSFSEAHELSVALKSKLFLL